MYGVFKINQIKYSHFSLSDKVDKDVQSVLFPLNLAQQLTLYPKYWIINDHIKPNRFISNLVSLIGTIIFVFIISYPVYTLLFYSNTLTLTSFTLISSYYDVVFYSLGFIINFIVSISHTKNALSFVFIFQNVHRFLNNINFTRAFIIWN